MIDPINAPSKVLRGAVFAKLKQSPALEEYLGDRLYDQLPVRQAAGGQTRKPAMPYGQWGPSDVVSDNFDCTVGSLITFQLDFFSNDFGTNTVEEISGLVKNILDEEELDLTDHYLVSLQHRITRYFRDPDGLTNHAAMTFEAMVEEGLNVTG